MNKQSKMSLSDLDIDFQKFCKKIKTAQQTTNLDSTAANQDSLFILLLVPSRFVAVLSRSMAVSVSIFDSSVRNKWIDMPALKPAAVRDHELRSKVCLGRLFLKKKNKIK